MQNVSCPSCGAQVQFRSHASVLAVCEYCKTTILKDADSVKDLGKMSDVLEDYSPIQIGTSGVLGSRSFTVIGRIQLRYAAGRWNEWYVLFDDGTPAWLGDSSGLYTLTNEKTGAKDLPAFADIVPGNTYSITGADYTAAEVRDAECIAGQGELPFQVGQGWQARVADFRKDNIFLTLDYSDSNGHGENATPIHESAMAALTPNPSPASGRGEKSEPLRDFRRNEPKVYAGQAVTLDDLKCQLLRDDDQVKTSAGKFKGKIDALSCPSCGSSIQYLPGVTSNIVCPSCQAQVDASGPTAQVLAAGDRMAQVHTTLELGAQATISGAQFTIIGAMRRSDDENTEWTEYLLHNPHGGFFWLVETDEGWSRAAVQEKWPSWSGGDSATLNKLNFRELYEYQAKVLFAAGAFNWRVKAGDTTRVIEFENGQTKSRLAAEITPEEMTWSQSTPVAADQIRAWFGKDVKADKADKAGSAGTAAGSKGGAGKFIFWILALNAIPLLLSFKSTWFYTTLALAAVYLPAKYLEHTDKADK